MSRSQFASGLGCTNTDQSYEVGYRKPPTHTQFRPGHSGNRKGRPKGARNVSTVLSEVANERVVVTENGGRKTITKLEAAIKQLANKAAGGDARATKLLLELLKENGESVANSVPTIVVISEADAKL